MIERQAIPRIFKLKSPAALVLKTAKGLFIVFNGENVSKTLSRVIPGFNPSLFCIATCGCNK